MDQQPAAVPQQAIPAGQTPDLCGWAEPSVWTQRMLAALHRGVKGGVWFSLIDKVYSTANLASAAAKVADNRGACGVDHVTVEQFCRHADENLRKLEEQLRQETY